MHEKGKSETRIKQTVKSKVTLICIYLVLSHNDKFALLPFPFTYFLEISVHNFSMLNYVMNNN